jgi:hypothetical protein
MNMHGGVGGAAASASAHSLKVEYAILPDLPAFSGSEYDLAHDGHPQ